MGTTHSHENTSMTIRLDHLIRVKQYWPRHGLDRSRVQEFVELMAEDEGILPPIAVLRKSHYVQPGLSSHEDRWLLVDGFPCFLDIQRIKDGGYRIEHCSSWHQPTFQVAP